MIARIIDCFDLVFNHDVIKELTEEDKQYNELLIENSNLRHEVEIVTKSRDKYLRNCRKKTEKIKELKEEIKRLQNGTRSV